MARTWTSMVVIGSAALGGVAALPWPRAVADDGSPESCVVEYVAQGIPVAEAIEKCAIQLSVGGVVVGEGGTLVVDVAWPTGKEGTAASVSCGAPPVDPRLGDDGGDGGGSSPTPTTTPGSTTPTTTPAPAPTPTTVPGDPAATPAPNEPSGPTKEDLQRAQEELQKFQAWQMMHNLDPKEQFIAGRVADALLRRVNAYAKGSWDYRTVEDHDGACAAVEMFVRECNQAAWKTGPCQLFLAELAGCADPLIARTDGEPGSGCDPEGPDEETAKQTVELLCSMRAKVHPDADPCTGGVIGLTTVRVPTIGTDEDPCPRDEHGYHTGECPGVELDPRDIVDLSTTVDDPRLGGPGAPDTDGPAPWPYWS